VDPFLSPPEGGLDLVTNRKGGGPFSENQKSEKMRKKKKNKEEEGKRGRKGRKREMQGNF